MAALARRAAKVVDSSVTPALRERFERLAFRQSELDANLADPAVSADVKRYRILSREQAEVSRVVTLFRRYQQRESELDGARSLLAESEGDAEMTTMARDEIAAAQVERPLFLRRSIFWTAVSSRNANRATGILSG